ncbi:hypothetical protein LIER_26515 [Lithospermum erythrorhizon]|uniref:Uncharacterized protein n=1 Tax=Lithospermum erythrorhizon TaxID=34254 RepID=A0AAV3R8M2_LITER
MREVVEVSSSASESERTELVDTEESPECFATEVDESSPPTPPIFSLAQKADNILRAGASSLWVGGCSGSSGKAARFLSDRKGSCLNIGSHLPE